MKKNIVMALSAVLLLSGVSVATATEPGKDLNSVLSSLRYTGQAISYYKSTGNVAMVSKLSSDFEELKAEATKLAIAKNATMKSTTQLDRAGITSSLRYTAQAIAYYKSIKDADSVAKLQDSYNSLLLNLYAVK